MVSVLFLIHLLAGFTTTVIASNATGSSMYLIPALRQTSISSTEIGREALAMSISPRQTS